MILKEMSESLTPWDSEADPQLNPLSQKRSGLVARRRVIPRYNSQGERTRVATSQKCQKNRALHRDVIKLQERVPTQMVTISDWQVEVKPLGFLRSQLVIKIPNQFITLPPKRSADFNKKSKSVSKLMMNGGMTREKISFKNFQREIEELDRLRTSKKGNIDLSARPKSKGLFKISETCISAKPSRQCSLKNMNPFDDAIGNPNAPQLRLHEKQTKKKHILDTLLSKFQ